MSKAVMNELAAIKENETVVKEQTTFFAKIKNIFKKICK